MILTTKKAAHIAKFAEFVWFVWLCSNVQTVPCGLFRQLFVLVFEEILEGYWMILWTTFWMILKTQ